MIIIEIKNSQELAQKEAPLKSKLLGKLAPHQLKQKVEEKVVEHLKNSFWERGIDAEILIRSSEDGG